MKDIITDLINDIRENDIPLAKKSWVYKFLIFTLSTALVAAIGLAVAAASEVNKSKQNSVEYLISTNKSINIDQGISDTVIDGIKKNGWDSIYTLQVFIVNRTDENIENAQFTIKHGAPEKEINHKIIYPKWAEGEWLDIDKSISGKFSFVIKKLPSTPQLDSFNNCFLVNFFLKEKPSEEFIKSVSISSITRDLKLVEFDSSKTNQSYWKIMLPPMGFVAFMAIFMYIVIKFTNAIQAHQIRKTLNTFMTLCEESGHIEPRFCDSFILKLKTILGITLYMSANQKTKLTEKDKEIVFKRILKHTPSQNEAQ